VSAVTASGLSIGHGGRVVVAGLDLDAPPGSLVALVGTNGSGKSTLLKTVAGLLPPVAGVLSLLGGLPAAAPARVAYLAQAPPAEGVLSLRVADVVRTGRFARLGLVRPTGASDRAAVERAMQRAEVAHLASTPLRALSGGQRQRVRLAQALAREAEVLLLDEPTAGLDATSRQRYLDLLDDERSRGSTVLTATHDLGEALRCDLVVLLAGRVVGAGPPADVLRPELLLDAFGVALQAVPHLDHTDVVVPGDPHGHDHGHDHDHETVRHGTPTRPPRSGPP
jgi:ABC-type Mn2+/Zn2+ transport system ATPase subunit